MANRGLKESAGRVESDMAVVEAEYGDFRRAREDMNSALALAQKPTTLINAALVFSLTGQVSRANSIMENLHTRCPKDASVNKVWIPVARATQEIANGHAKHGLELLESSRSYELGQTAEFLPVYRRGVAYEREKDAADAAVEFQKIIDHRGVSPTSELYPLAVLGIAQAAAMAGNIARSHDYYERFLNQWKEADADIPILREARAEYRKLR